jgi:hypothetical protein
MTLNVSVECPTSSSKGHDFLWPTIATDVEEGGGRKGEKVGFHFLNLGTECPTSSSKGHDFLWPTITPDVEEGGGRKGEKVGFHFLNLGTECPTSSSKRHDFLWPTIVTDVGEGGGKKGGKVTHLQRSLCLEDMLLEQSTRQLLCAAGRGMTEVNFFSVKLTFVGSRVNLKTIMIFVCVRDFIWFLT